LDILLGQQMKNDLDQFTESLDPATSPRLRLRLLRMATDDRWVCQADVTLEPSSNLI
jgi:hypothetical protein